MGKVTVQRFYRPEDVGREHAYKAEFWEVYASDESAALDPDDVFGKCAVVREGRAHRCGDPTLHEAPELRATMCPLMRLDDQRRNEVKGNE